MARKKKNSSGAVDEENAKKRGNPGDIHGSCAAFLHEKVDGYCDASKNKTTRKFFPKLWKEYWARFPWDLPFEQEPPKDLEGYGRPDNELTVDELSRKTEIQKKTQVKIKRWLTYVRRNKRGGKNPYRKWLHQLSHIEERPPKRMALYQLYMQDEKKNDNVNKLFQERYPELVGTGNSIQQRTAIARELLAMETEEARADLKRKGDEAFEAAMAEFRAGNGVEAEAVDDPVVQKEARGQLAVTVQPLLDSLRAITGCQLLLVAGTVVDGKFDIRCMHAKAPGVQGLDLTAWDPVGFKPVLDQIMRYLVAAASDPQATGPLQPRETEVSQQDGSSTTPPVIVPPPLPPTAPAPGQSTTRAPPQQVVSAAAASSLASGATVEPISSRTRNRGSKSKAKKGGAKGKVNVDADEESDSDDDEEGSGSDDDDEDEDDDGSGGEEDDDDADGWDGDGDEWAGWGEELDSRLDALPLVASPLKRAIKRLPPSDQEYRLRQLEGGNELFVTRESNMARTAELLENLGIKNDVANLMKELKAANKRPIEEGGGQPSKRRKPNEEEEYDDGEEGDDDGNGDGNAEAAAGVKQVRGGKDKNVRAPPGVDANGVAHWALSAKSQLLAGEGDDMWTNVVALWWKREEQAGFDGPAKAIGTKFRPAQVSGWINRARVGGPQPAILDVYAFAAQWWQYWVAINPEWRTRLEGGGGTRLGKEGQGDWGTLKGQTGKNGLLNVLICLRWWKDVLRIGSVGAPEGILSKQWQEAVGDLLWVLEKMGESETPPTPATTPTPTLQRMTLKRGGEENPSPSKKSKHQSLAPVTDAVRDDIIEISDSDEDRGAESTAKEDVFGPVIMNKPRQNPSFPGVYAVDVDKYFRQVIEMTKTGKTKIGDALLRVYRVSVPNSTWYRHREVWEARQTNIAVIVRQSINAGLTPEGRWDPVYNQGRKLLDQAKKKRTDVQSQ
ncbi:hypothetical protein R3P38DRAFT_3521484 [Favolaschia claudopus]|uniref:Uncharacterized protein n=1 Tax=Favolaschia claudopus TaxID=2862362 RepID=A0AAW0BPL0_9AGAR